MNGTTKWIIGIALVIVLACIPAFISSGRNAQRLDNHDKRIEGKADSALVELELSHINKKLDNIIEQLNKIKKNDF